MYVHNTYMIYIDRYTEALYILHKENNLTQLGIGYDKVPPLFQSGSPPFFEEIIPMKLNFIMCFVNIFTI